ncbi:hypothetical protein DVB69_06435 [Sporosarcina sp. BI001-red]|uniref:hypothetical protein n=1 Tax=Sporosarcina sp. BI001-red TaxID=2282866 RepID=UPI000E251DF0|nr:hypothetical protein [Sporosarcina sp. BI001-red]REB08756.1 hypothetical protein DVB69_06435 [Sporosarcina sp. BI001-red]
MDGIYVPGNITVIEGAKVAIRQGITEGLAIANKLNGGIYKVGIQEATKRIDHPRPMRSFNPIFMG